jgi:predicted glycosyl hydrolase (DUF1957 family)
VILICNRAEYRKHLENQLAMLDAQQKSERRPDITRAIADGLRIALEVLSAWEEYDRQSA